MIRHLGPLQAVAFLAAFAFGIPAEIGAQLSIWNGLDLAALLCALGFLALLFRADLTHKHTTTTEGDES